VSFLNFFKGRGSEAAHASSILHVPKFRSSEGLRVLGPFFPLPNLRLRRGVYPVSRDCL